MNVIMDKMSLSEGGVLSGANPLKIFFNKVLPQAIRKKLSWIDRNTQKLLYGVDVFAHGDVGPNGSRGAIEAFTKSSHPIFIGHSHTPGIRKNVYQVGHCSYSNRGYNPGYSSWVHTMGLIYPNGKRTLFNIIDGRWRP